MPIHEVLGVLGLPLLAALLFACAAIFLKLNAKQKIDIWRVSFVANIVTALSFQPYWFAFDGFPSLNLWWQPAVVAMLFVMGQVLTLISLTKGEISVSAPVLGLKILFVPLFIWVLGIGLLPSSIWLSCGLAVLAVVLLNYTPESSNRGRVVFSVVTAGGGAACFALFDVCVQLWSDRWGHGGFLPSMFLCSSLFSLAFIPLFDEPLRMLPRSAWKSLSLAAMFFALQALAIVASVAFWGQAAASNVVYSTRGLWSLLMIWALGSLLGIADSSLSPRVFVVRLGGALVLFVAIVLLLM